MSTSRRTFLKGTIAGAGAVVGELRALGIGSNGSAPAADPVGGTQSTSLAPATFPTTGEEYTRGVGVYPGDPREDFGPTLVPDASTYRNLALHRPAYHSSCYDYNLTAQLVTDGIKDSHLPDWVATSVSFRGLLPKIEREFFLDHNPTSVVDLRGPRPWVQVQLGGGASIPEIDRVDVLFVAPTHLKPQDVTVSVSASRGWPGMEGIRQSDEPKAGACQWLPGGVCATRAIVPAFHPSAHNFSKPLLSSRIRSNQRPALFLRDAMASSGGRVLP